MANSSAHDGQWRQKPGELPDRATLVDQAIASVAAQLLRVPLPLSFVRPAQGWDTSFDLDAMTMTNPDLAANGWTISLTHTPFTVLTRAGDVRAMDHLWSASAGAAAPGTTPNYPPAAGTYYSTLVGGRLLIQLPGQTDVSIHRTTTQGAWLYTAGIGGGSARDNARSLYIANGAPGAAGVRSAFSNEFAAGVTASGVAMGVNVLGYGAQAVHLALETPAMLQGGLTGQWIRANFRPLFPGGSGVWITGALIDCQHGAPLAATSRVGVRLYSGPVSYNTELSAPVELFYIRRQAHRALAYW